MIVKIASQESLLQSRKANPLILSSSDDIIAVTRSHIDPKTAKMSTHHVLYVDGDVDIVVEETCKPDDIKDKGSSRHAPRRQVRIRQRRGPKYQTNDLIREKSPKVMKDVVSEENKEESETVQDSNILEPRRTVECNICKHRMTESRLANHIRLMHLNTDSTNTKDFRCGRCGKSYAVKYTYEQHLKTHTEGRPKCPECGSTFATAFSLFRHRARTHNIEHSYKTVSCDECDKVFFSSSELTCHKQRHANEKTHKCQECDKSFSAKGNLRIHMRTHAKEKPYKCDMCENSFSHPFSLVSHRRIHTNEYPFECTECGKSYRSKHQLTSHKTVHTDERPFNCDQCTKTFRSRTAFRMHQDQHKGIKRFACQYCGRKFQCNANKTKHERRHVGVKRFECSQCDKAFIERQELRNHEKVHDKQKTTQTDAAGTNGTAETSKTEDDDDKVVEAAAH